jgi:hypothetical protein
MKTAQNAMFQKVAARLDLALHFEAVFDKIMQTKPERTRAETVEALASEVVSWVEGYDEFLTDGERPAATNHKEKRAHKHNN